jgi:superfamily II DNA or RNA helicase
MQAGDFNQKQLAEAVNTSGATSGARRLAEYADGSRRSLHGRRRARARARGSVSSGRHPRAAISGETPKDDRRLYLRQYHRGQIDVITNCMVLTEGTDLPATRCILHAKPTKQRDALRADDRPRAPALSREKECIVIDVVDIARRHSLQVAGVLYGLPPSCSRRART